MWHRRRRRKSNNPKVIGLQLSGLLAVIYFHISMEINVVNGNGKQICSEWTIVIFMELQSNVMFRSIDLLLKAHDFSMKNESAWHAQKPLFFA